MSHSRTAEPDSCCSPGWAVQERAKRGFLEDLRIGAELATTVVFDAVRGLIRKVLFMPEKQIFSPLGFDGRATGWVDDNKVTIKTQCATLLYGRGSTALDPGTLSAMSFLSQDCSKHVMGHFVRMFEMWPLDLCFNKAFLQGRRLLYVSPIPCGAWCAG